ncbi:DegQ family serine endoprotease [Pararhodospirillum oryzae]|uniref:Probable periplasmic serine endoprotease DegP-like n=1 Tax=Pararhodospirillum oryzae TaxID=478448 RepID=A0A512H946_9PROT|nr:DegQ family serine endoprotease [Pararhodospirillum oryzae]GEO81975.1 serine protease [Pararhodospirillum oryzae]
MTLSLFDHAHGRTPGSLADRPQRSPRRLIAGVVLALGVVGLPMVQGPQPAQAREIPDSFADLAETLLPSVVNISTTQILSGNRGPEMPQFPPGSPFEEFFKDFFDRHGAPGVPNGKPRLQQRRATSLGSGFIIDSSGLIVTNNHVIKDAEEITVILQDNTALKAEVVGADEKTDVALLKVDAKSPLPAVAWGDADTARVGDWVMAIGNPFGLGGTVTAGIISAKTRDINAGPYDNFIQTDAAINKGNSGGPLFNVKGEVIGINTAIFSPSGGSVGIGFAVPSTLAKQVVSDLKQYGRTRRGWIGVRIQSVTDEIAEGLKLDKARGALVAAITAGGPSEKAGLKLGDVILTFDGHDVPDMRSLPRLVAETDIGKKVAVTVWRDGKEQNVKMEVAELEKAEADGLLGSDAQTAPDDSGGVAIEGLGLSVARLDDRARSEFGYDQDETGLVITAVTDDSDAAKKGLEPGVLIVRVNQTDVETPEDLTRAITAARKEGRKTVLMLVEVRGNRTFIPVRLGGAE